jgi:hypothetical protein
MSANKNLSLFIPFVFPNFDQKYVANAFAKIGNVDRVDFVAKQDRAGKTYNAVYVHFKEWHNNTLANYIWEECFQNNGKAEFYHDDTEYFWIVLPNTAKKHMPGERKPRICLGDSNTINVKSAENDSSCPKKENYAEVLTVEKPDTKEVGFDEYIEMLRAPVEELDTERENQIAEIEAAMEEEDKDLINIDWRYVHAIEQENKWLHGEIAQLRMALINMDQMYQAEAAKVRAVYGISVDI